MSMMRSYSENSDRQRRRVLLIAYSFPPVGGAGVQRPTKWTKYLPQFGWDVTVLTPENPSVPLRDESLLADIPPETRIIRARTLEPDYRVKQQMAGASQTSFVSAAKSLIKRGVLAVLQPDLQILWARNAIRTAAQELERQQHDAILVTVPPYSMLSIGVKLKRRFGLPLVFDFRDEWDLSSRYLEHTPRGWWSRTIQSRLQCRWLKQADAVIATTEASARTYQQKLAEVGNRATASCIYNGFDFEDIDRVTASGRKSDGVFRLVYTGTLWNLTDIEPLVAAIERLHVERQELVGRLELSCIGRKTPDQQRILDRVAQTSCRTEFVDYCDHRQIAARLHAADALCLLLSDVPGAERVVPAKMFEYLAVRKPILSIAPYGEMTRLVRRFLPEGHFVPRDLGGIAGWLADRLARPASVASPFLQAQSLHEFSRQELTNQLADVLDRVSGRKPPAPHDWSSDDPILRTLDQPVLVNTACDV